MQFYNFDANFSSFTASKLMLALSLDTDSANWV